MTDEQLRTLVKYIQQQVRAARYMRIGVVVSYQTAELIITALRELEKERQNGS